MELPEGMTENDFTDKELEKMLSSEKLTDFPWSIHHVADSFTKFLEISDFNVVNNQFFMPESEILSTDILFYGNYFNIELSDSIEKFLIKFSGINFVKKIFSYNNMSFRIHKIYNISEKESNNLYYIYERKKRWQEKI